MSGLNSRNCLPSLRFPLSPYIISRNIKIIVNNIRLSPVLFVWVQSLVSHIKGRTDIKGHWEEGAENNISDLRGSKYSSRKLESTA